MPESQIEWIVLITAAVIHCALMGAGLCLFLSGRKRASWPRRITGLMLTAVALVSTAVIGRSLWNEHDRRTNPVRIFEDRLGVRPPDGVTRLQGERVKHGGFQQHFLRWECSAETFARLIPKNFRKETATDLLRQPGYATPYRQPAWWSLPGGEPGHLLYISPADEVEHSFLAFAPARGTAWFYRSYMGSDFLQ
jgi:hypothetical protein